MQRIAMLGSGFIGRFYADSLQGYRSRDSIVSIYSRREESARKFAEDYQCHHYTTVMEEAIAREDVDIVCIALPNNLHEAAVLLCCKHKKAVMTTKPLGRNAAEAKRMLEAVEAAGIFNGYLEDLVYTPKFIKANQSVKEGALGRILWAKSRETHPGPHSEWFWDIEQAGGGCILDLGCHCVEITRSYIGKDIKPVEVMCWADTQVKPIDAEDHAIGLVKYENGAIGQFEVSWTFRGGLDLRDEVMGTEGTIWINSFLRTGFDMFTTGKGGDYIAEKAESNSGWLFPVGDELNELGYNHMFMDMFNALEKGVAPKETFYDGYVVNAILDAAYKSAKSKIWEPVQLDIWRGQTGLSKESHLVSYDQDHYLVKEEMTHYGAKKLILKHKTTGKITEQLLN
ncbi:MAG TPA: Gfo/Idh/MocA family oxidoreductase [Sediminibacterium sp.]|jgi:predicted dehydrogenase|uniref:Gfo/Idh/MocA family protein n=1 Tax=Sediminibacterium sp. TaxID=1917865 RepID=UPI0008B4A078|nr:Gfo/Idh/MocA family oxidoreductase [Sediminibacterium sp.]OHC85755.1 MAG: oxidoreductase [Sphingobacteriia bacterium RIFOXYC2_FULL_35_18]OHC87291.1 MAG: oxidoreductase [Sphingobacteriia bacterium RIFOXYD2_FULL_35_12]OYY10182.1 MAG: oxidoreductase [Sphingobacteriia bacterium 35-36-14]OYZ54958.1 MAG: oxidoreductase [Sphingobacteriia bacterium 24-36-13]OZA66093.1 MAG: oxidoreductase [Sphingobacteriia bacterium 39-36-14]